LCINGDETPARRRRDSVKHIAELFRWDPDVSKKRIPLTQSEIESIFEQEREKSRLQYLRADKLVKRVSVPIFVIILSIGIYAGSVVYEVGGLKFFVTFSLVTLFLSLTFSVVGHCVLRRTQIKNSPFLRVIDFFMFIGFYLVLSLLVHG
jgi:hypothetical protein